MMIKKKGTKYFGDLHEIWMNWWLLENNPAIPDLDIFHELDLAHFYSQPGGRFDGSPSIWRIGKRCLVTQICGYDV